MFVKSLTILNYRNYIKENFSFHKNFNLILGKNGQGKTNLIEAINMLCNFMPFKKTVFDELIHFGSEETRLKGELYNRDIMNEVNIHITKNKKIIKYNNKIIYRTKKYSNLHKTVIFLPRDTELIKGPVLSRRNYLDSFISDSDISHYVNLQNYYKSLKQRKALLVNYKKSNLPFIEIWNQKLSEFGERIVGKRKSIIKEFNPLLNEYYKKISGDQSKVEIVYHNSFNIKSSYGKDLYQELNNHLELDLRKKITSFGPHRDKISININDRESSSFASQGEAKSLVLSLKISEIELYRKISGENPVLILDDITSELDDNRRDHINDFLNSYSGQIFITMAKTGNSLNQKADKIFKIENGRNIF